MASVTLRVFVIAHASMTDHTISALARFLQGSTFVLCVYLKFQNVEDRDEFIASWKPLAEWVKANEAGTLGYEAMIADTDPLKVMVFERYVSKDYFNDVHRTSQPYLTFKEQQGSWRAEHAVEVSGQSYFETGVGHMTRPDSQA